MSLKGNLLMSRRLSSYRAFWPYYLGEHSRSATRLLHGIGTVLAVLLLIAGMAHTNWPLAAAAIVTGYAFAWAGHCFIEKNRPATFQYPLWSLISDFRMLALWLAGRLEAELARHCIAPRGR